MTAKVTHGAIVVASFELPHHDGFDWHRHDGLHQLAWATDGVLAVSAVGRTWVLPSTRALWIPSGVEHAVEATRAARMRSLYFWAKVCTVGWSEPTVVMLQPLLRELAEHLSRPELSAAERARAEAVVLDVLQPLDVATLQVSLPSEPRARRVAEALLERPAERRTLGAWGRRVGASERTLARAFVRDTGMSFGAWRGHARIRCALELLAEGRSVNETGYAVGYESPSAFVAAFRRLVGTSPATYFAKPRTL